MKSIRLFFTALALICLGGVARADDRLWKVVKELCLDIDLNQNQFEKLINSKEVMKKLDILDVVDKEYNITKPFPVLDQSIGGIRNKMYDLIFNNFIITIIVDDKNYFSSQKNCQFIINDKSEDNANDFISSIFNSNRLQLLEKSSRVITYSKKIRGIHLDTTGEFYNNAKHYFAGYMFIYKNKHVSPKNPKERREFDKNFTSLFLYILKPPSNS